MNVVTIYEEEDIKKSNVKSRKKKHAIFKIIRAMTDLAELLITTDENGLQWTCCAWDPRNGTHLMVYRGGGAANSHGLCILRNSFVISADSTKPLLHIWPVNSQDQLAGSRFVIPGKASALEVSNDGKYLIAGIQETIYVWETSSGKMLNSLAKHYQNVSVLKFTDDDSHFISAGQDGVILVWNLTRVVSEREGSQQILYTFKDHALPVTDVHVGKGGIRGFLCSVSMDRTCKIYDLSSGTLLSNLVFGEPLLSVAMDILETSIYVGSGKGPIYEFSIESPPRTKEYHMKQANYQNKFDGHEEGVTCISLSLDGEILVSGGNDSKIFLWHRKSKQVLRILSHKGAITNAFFTLAHKNFFSTDKKMHPIATNLKRMMDSEDDGIIEIFCTDEPTYDDMIPTRTPIYSATSSTSNENNEIENLRKEITKLKRINKELFEYSTKNILLD